MRTFPTGSHVRKFIILFITPVLVFSAFFAGGFQGAQAAGSQSISGGDVIKTNPLLTTQSLVNGGFEQNATGWTLSSMYAYITSGEQGVLPHGGSKMAVMINWGIPGVPDNYIEQTFTVPDSSATALSFWMSSSVGCGPLCGGGSLEVYVNGLKVPYSGPPGDASAWKNYYVNLGPYRGQTITLRLLTHSIYAVVTNFIDDITLTTPPVLGNFKKIGPATGAINQLANTTFSWGASQNASEYYICLDTTDDDSCTDWWNIGGFTSRTISPALAADTTYYWQVKAVNEFNSIYANGDGTDFWSFKTLPAGAPNILSLDRTSLLRGSPDFTLTVTGPDYPAFVEGTQVLWNGSPRPTGFISPTKVSAQISAADVATAGIINVSVLNPALVESNPLPVTIYSFADVAPTYWAWSWIESLANNGVTSGCSLTPYLYCPSGLVTRAQMAVFLLRAEHGQTYTPPAATGVFADVPVSYWAANWIEQLAAEGITSGCSITPKKYCPEGAVTRDQMAVFLLRAEHGSAYIPPAASGVFTDVPVSFWAANWIEQLALEGVTSGCSVTPKKYCPSNPVMRDQMAVFLVKTFSLP